MGALEVFLPVAGSGESHHARTRDHSSHPGKLTLAPTLSWRDSRVWLSFLRRIIGKNAIVVWRRVPEPGPFRAGEWGQAMGPSFACTVPIEEDLFNVDSPNGQRIGHQGTVATPGNRLSAEDGSRLRPGKGKHLFHPS